MDQKLQTYLNLNPYYVYGEKETPLQIEEKEKKFSAMPLNLRLICISAEISDTIKNIAINKYSLSLFLAQKLSYLIRLVFFGELAIYDFINRVAQDLQIDKQTAQKIALDINQDIFKKVTLELKGLQRKFPTKIKQEDAPKILNKKPEEPLKQNIINNKPSAKPPEKLPTLEGEYNDRSDKYLEPITPESAIPKPAIKGNLVNLKSKN